jgi:hypothetical protein
MVIERTDLTVLIRFSVLQNPYAIAFGLTPDIIFS